MNKYEITRKTLSTVISIITGSLSMFKGVREVRIFTNRIYGDGCEHQTFDGYFDVYECHWCGNISDSWTTSLYSEKNGNIEGFLTEHARKILRNVEDNDFFTFDGFEIGINREIDIIFTVNYSV